MSKPTIQFFNGNLMASDDASWHLSTQHDSFLQQIYQQNRARVLAQRRGAEHPEPVATT